MQTISGEFWEVRIPDDWIHKPGQADPAFYFESPDNKAGVYLSAWKAKDGQLATAVRSAGASELRNLPGGGNWEILYEKEIQEDSQIELASEYFNRETSYRLVSRVLGRDGWFVRLTFHDYACVDPVGVQSLRTHEKHDAP